MQNGQTVEFSVADLVSGLQTEITSSNKLSADLVDDTGTTNQFATSSQLTKLDNLANIQSIGSNLSLNSSTGELSATDTTYTAGTNVNISAQNVISATDTTYSNFVGTDGNTGGTSGLVPAPLTTDVDKFLKSDGTWDTAGGGGGPTVVQTTGTSQTDVMSQNATTSMIYADPSTKKQIRIGNTGFVGDYSVSIGSNANSNSSNYVGINTSSTTTPYWWKGGVYIGEGATSTTGLNLQGQVAIGQYANAGGNYSIAIGRSTINMKDNAVTIGRGSTARAAGVFGIGCQYGGAYNNTNYRVIEGVHDGEDLHDAATVAQGNTLATSAPTTSTVGVLGQLYTDTTNMHTYQCTAIAGDTYTWTQRW